MAPRFQTLPPAQTASAREARRAFFCELCQKGYTRMNEYESHLSSYDHAHKQRMKDMKAMVRDPSVAERARRLEAKADAVISIKLGGDDSNHDGSPASGIKKGGFRKGGFKSAFSDVTNENQATTASTSTGDATQKSLPIISMPTVSSASASAPSASTSQLPPPQPLPVAGAVQVNTLLDESDTDNEDYEVYDPRKPTD
ncbi:hypothetical protein SEUCBS139899_006555 [Sporothrix eucalyptigena]|uniref:C2H2-type domain-containing protein n=1 Tax=Sporothrix eucalyptigena TaxID=1812306 RepID=A0ABP0B865_9PEZI